MNTVPWLLSLLLMASCSHRAARVYSWVDPRGDPLHRCPPLPARRKEVDRLGLAAHRHSPTRSRWTASAT